MALKRGVLVGLFILGLSRPMLAQSEDLTSRLTSFEAEISEQFKKIEYNVVEPEWGALNNSEPDHHTYFQWKSRKKRRDNLERKNYHKIDFAVYEWNDPEDGTWALKSWMDEFMEGRKLRPGREVRAYEYAQPSVVIMDTNYVVIAQMRCADYFEEEFDDWVKLLEKHFGHSKAMTLELYCGGPLKWTKNAPDPNKKKKRKRRRRGR